jgi:Rne/Rng family ribonuclease
MMPGMAKLGVSRKIEDEEERKRLRQILDSLKPPKDCGFIIRTAGVGKSKAEIERDLKYLTRLYENINKKAKASSGPTELYAEGDLVTRTVRDVMTSDVERIVVDSDDVAKKIKEFFKLVAPRTKNKVDFYDEPVPLFHKYGIEKEIELMYSRHVPLPSGGSLVIDSTEAIVAIDVNSGKFREHADAETTAFKTDLEAADEIPRQLRLRDLGGVIICDFIDLRFERHRRDLEKRLHENLNRDRAKTKMLRMSQFGIIEMTRQRMRPSLKRSIYNDCPHCHGSGQVKTPESMSLDVMRRLAIGAHDERVIRIELAVCADVAFYLQNRKRAQLAHLEQESGKRIIIRTDPALALDDHRLELYDARDGLVFLPELGMTPADQPQFGGGRGGRGGQQQQGRGGDRHRDQRGGGGGRGDREERGARGDRGERDQQRGGRDERGGRGGGRDQRQERGGGRGRGRDQQRAGDQFDVESVEDQVDERETDREEQAVADASLDAPLPPPQEITSIGEEDESEFAAAPAAAYEQAGDEEEHGEEEHDESDGPADAPTAIEDSEEEESVAQSSESDDDAGDEEDEGAGEEEADEDDDDADRAQRQGGSRQREQAASQPQPPQPQPSPQGRSPYEDYEEEIELQPRGITHERPTLKEQARGGRGGNRGGGGRRGGRGGRGGPVQQKVDLGPPAPRGEGEMSLAERFAMELAAEKAARRQPQGGGGGQGGQGGQGNRSQQQGGGGGQHRQAQQHQQHQQRRQGGPGGQGGQGNRPQHQGGGGGGGGGQHRQPQQHQQHRQGGGQQAPQNQGGGQQRHDGGGGGGGGQGEGGGRRGRRRRRGRGGRSGNGGGGNQGGGNAGPGGGGGGGYEGDEGDSGYESSSAVEQAAPQPQQVSQPSPQQPVRAPQPPVQRTGSTDRHLLHDQPVEPQPLSRPRTYRDLDQIPDDFD